MAGAAMSAILPQGLLAPAHPRPRPAFALTPLADIMFQLLIFFMLSTSLAPYALLPLGQPAAAAAAATPAPPPAATVSPAVWHLGQGRVRSGLRWMPLTEVDAALGALRAEGTAEILLFVTPDATTQDLARLLELVQTQGGLRLRLIAR